MANFAIRYTPRAGALPRLAGRMMHDAAFRASTRTAQRARDNLVTSGRVDTGRLRDSIRAEPPQDGQLSFTVRVVAGTPYASFQEKGTRAHGPVRARFLRFKPKGSSVVVFAKWVRGVTGAHFMQRAARALTRRDFLP